MRHVDIYTYKNKPYQILRETKIKLEGVWVDCVIYKTLYHNPDGDTWVRTSYEFYKLFEKKKG